MDAGWPALTASAKLATGMTRIVLASSSGQPNSSIVFNRRQGSASRPGLLTPGGEHGGDSMASRRAASSTGVSCDLSQK